MIKALTIKQPWVHARMASESNGGKRSTSTSRPRVLRRNFRVSDRATANSRSAAVRAALTTRTWDDDDLL
jgi:hypothetical protein